MLTLKFIDLKDDLKADKIIGFCENAFRAVLLLLAAAGLIKSDIIHVYQGSLLYHSLMTFTESFIPNIIRKTTKVYITAEFRLFFLIFILISQFLGEIADLYMKLPWWDLMVHVYSAFLITLLGYIIVHMMYEAGKKISAYYASTFAVSFSMAVGVLWEIFEYLMDTTFGFHMQKSGLVDTMEDLIICLIGSLVFCAIYIYDSKNNKFSVITRMIHRFVEKNSKSD